MTQKTSAQLKQSVVRPTELGFGHDEGRVETQLGFTMVKYIRAIEFVANYKNIQQGKGGYWEDQGYEWYAGI